jgi:hypothetical protein
LPFFGQNCSLPFSLTSLDIPALLKSWKKHYDIYEYLRFPYGMQGRKFTIAMKAVAADAPVKC